MNNEYYTVCVAVKGNMVVGTGLQIVRDFAMPYDKTWFRDEYTFKEKSFESYAEACAEQEKWDKVIGINFDDYSLDFTGEKVTMRRSEI